MVEYGTDSIQTIVNLYPRFDGKDKTQFLEYKDKLCVSLSFHRQSVVAILQSEPKPTTAQNSPAAPSSVTIAAIRDTARKTVSLG